MKKIILWACVGIGALLLSGCSFRSYINASSYKGNIWSQAIQETWYPSDYNSRMSRTEFVQHAGILF